MLGDIPVNNYLDEDDIMYIEYKKKRIENILIGKFSIFALETKSILRSGSIPVSTVMKIPRLGRIIIK